ncbi:hypothetical protein PAPYR_4388 [Paratrimastix pyriformis]|uniref:t-SNARE coiled-coil homology domain-containing protein n=1 Tax=Paratrimastix pyriformis TaxID=342808 RepID=A0ABQ8UK93_9EUKA|nr:hypothetical protein PAPYR_4388 [Paratrimastix pyriformis]
MTHRGGVPEDLRRDEDRFEDEYDENDKIIGEIQMRVTTLKNTVSAIHTELQSQNTFLDTMRAGMEKAKAALGIASNKLGQVIKMGPGKPIWKMLGFAMLMVLLIWLFYFKIRF